jgi:uncharacterized protein
MNNDSYLMRFDGACRGNPGKSSIGVVIYKNDSELLAYNKYLGDDLTNNYSEYKALELGIIKCIELNIPNIIIEGDSLLVVNQILNKWNTKNEKLKIINNRCKQLLLFFDTYNISHIKRALNKRADYLANVSLDNL